MNPKLQPNRKIYMEALRRMTPAQRLDKAIELTESSRQLFKQGLRKRFPDADSATLHAMFLKRLATCHNRNY